MARQDGRATIRPDTRENILYITLSGTIRAKQVDSIYTDIRFAVADLQPGFAVINDMSVARLAYLSGIGSFKKITAFLLSSGVGPIVRILGEQNVISAQVLRVSTAMEGYTPLYADSVEEAKQMIAAQRASQQGS